MHNPYMENQHLLCAPELKRYVLLNLFSGDEILVTDRMLLEAFDGDEAEVTKIKSGRNPAWLVNEYFD